MRVLFDFFINIARWAWLRMDFFKAKLLMDKIIDFSVFDKIISQEISVRSPEELTRAFLCDQLVPFKTLLTWNV